MKWQDYVYQPIGHVLSRGPVVDPDSWVSLVHDLDVIRVSGVETQTGKVSNPSPEVALGAHFRPDTPVSLELLQIAGLLLKNNRLDRALCAWSARRHGGGLYFKWFLAQVDDAEVDPLPAREFPLHRSRWRKRKAGRRIRNAK